MMQKRLLRFIQPVMIGLAILFILYLLSAQWGQLRNQPWRLHAGWLAISSAFLLASWTLEIAVWRYLLHLLGGNVPFWPAARVWFLSAIVRYVPGNIWQPLSMTLRCRQYGVAPETTLTSVVLYQVVILLAAYLLRASTFRHRQLRADYPGAGGCGAVAGRAGSAAGAGFSVATAMAHRHPQLGAASHWPSGDGAQPHLCQSIYGAAAG
ncbi:MAG: lysylphosphatidylglycerol synthase domain-containing protein [Caldilineaceae bacterium]